MESVKVLLETWRRYDQGLNESRLYSMSPSELSGEEFNKAATTQKLDKTDLSKEETIREVLDTVIRNKSIAISFVNSYKDKSGKFVVPSLGVSPNISYDTPHGIYTYPLNLENVAKFLYTGQPTDAEFATDAGYFHLIKDDDIKSVVINADKSTNYDNRNYKSDSVELVRVFMNYVVSYMSENSEIVSRINNELGSSQSRINLDDLRSLTFDDIESLAFDDIVVELYQYIYSYFESRYDISRTVDNSVIVKITSFLDRLSLTSNNRFEEEANNEKFYKLYYIAYFCSNFLTCVFRQVSSVKESSFIKPGGLFTMLLTAVGINNIIDNKGTGTIHGNEPTQAVYTDISNLGNIKLLGTYKNIFSPSYAPDIDLVESILEEYYEKGLLNSATSYYIPDSDYEDEVELEADAKDIIDKINAERPNINEKFIKIYDVIAANVNSGFNDEVYSKCVNIFKDIHDVLTVYCDSVYKKYYDNLSKTNIQPYELDALFNVASTLHRLFYHISWNIAGPIVTKEAIKKNLEKQHFLSSDLSKVNFVKFQNYMNDLIASLDGDDQNNLKFRNKFITFTIAAFGGKAKLKKIEKGLNTSSIKDVYKDIF